MAQLTACSFFHPNRIAEGPFFVVERELVGHFEGQRMFFNAFDSLVASASLRRHCLADLENEIVRCTDTTVDLSGQLPEEAGAETMQFSIRYHYDSDLAVHLEYLQDGVPVSPFRIFRGGEIRGAAMQVYGDTVIPYSDVKSTLDMTIIRDQRGFTEKKDDLPRYYFERRQYSYLGLPVGYDLTIWHRVEGGSP